MLDKRARRHAALLLLVAAPLFIRHVHLLQSFSTLHPTKLFITLHLEQSFSPLFISNNPFSSAVAPSLSTHCPSATPTSAGARFFLRPAVMSTAMEPIPKHDSKQASQAEPTAEEIKDWDEVKMLQWTQDKRGKVLNSDKLQI